MEESINITLKRKVKPLRLAFLVQPSSRTQLLRALQINTVLWGGRFNPIVPVYQRTPPFWESKPLTPPAATDVIQGYLRAFDPDFVVNMTNRQITLKGYEEESYKKRVLSPHEVLDPNKVEDPVSYGIDVTEVYEYLYSEEFRFERRNPMRVVLPQAQDGRMDLLASACYGSFPPEKELEYFKRRYLEAFNAEVISVGPERFHEPLEPGVGYPLRIGSAFLQHGLRFRGGDTASLYYLDERNNLDIMDYWNLRAAGWLVFPVPRRWASELLEPAKKFIEQNYRPYRHNPQMMHSTTLQKARAVSEEEVTAFYKSLQLPDGEMLSVRHWYPRIWDDWARDKDFVDPVEIYSEDEDIEIQYSGGRITFKDKRPKFADRWGGRGSPRWANVFVFSKYGGSDEHAEVIPIGLAKVGRAIGAIGVDRVRSGKDGLVVACEHSDFLHYWELPSSLKVFEAWAERNGYKLALSAAGKVTQQLLRQVGGVWGAWSFAHPEILKLIEKMARGATIAAGEMSERIKAVYSGQAHPRSDRHLKFLIEKQMVRVGVELQCDHCQQRTWYALNSVREDLRCEKCLSEFPFPAERPPSSPWHYRASGPFSIPGYCHGAYCVALALRLLTKTLHGSATAIPSFTLKAGDGTVIEADLGLFYRSEAWFDSEPYLIFGECKTFDRFTEQDVRRMRALGKKFSGSVLAFCTLNDQLTAKEKRLLQPLARGGRRYLGGDKWRNPVLILTRIELLHDFSPEYAWRDAGGKYAEFADQRQLDTLPELCDATQQLHLGMESYWKTLEQWRQKRQQRLAKGIAAKEEIV